MGATGGKLDATYWKDEFGIPEDFVQEVATLVDPGSSAIYAILESADPEVVAARFQGYGGTVLRTTLTEGQKEKIEKALRNAN